MATWVNQHPDVQIARARHLAGDNRLLKDLSMDRMDIDGAPVWECLALERGRLQRRRRGGVALRGTRYSAYGTSSLLDILSGGVHNASDLEASAGQNRHGVLYLNHGLGQSSGRSVVLWNPQGPWAKLDL